MSRYLVHPGVLPDIRLREPHGPQDEKPSQFASTSDRAAAVVLSPGWNAAAESTDETTGGPKQAAQSTQATPKQLEKSAKSDVLTHPSALASKLESKQESAEE